MNLGKISWILCARVNVLNWLLLLLIWYNIRVRITISCQMNFDDYPLDDHTCQFQVGSCEYLNPVVVDTRDTIADYDTQETVTCSAFFIYDTERQRSLQHFIQIEGLPPHFDTVIIPSGVVWSNVIEEDTEDWDYILPTKHCISFYFWLIVRHLLSLWLSSEDTEETNAVCSSGIAKPYQNQTSTNFAKVMTS